MVERVCVVCGVSFKRKHSRQKSCSYECSRRNELNKDNARRRKNTRKNCIICGNSFVVNTGPQKTCGGECRKERIKETAAKYRKSNIDNPLSSRYRGNVKEYSLEYRAKNKESLRESKRLYGENNPNVYVRSSLKFRLGFQPPEELVEEYAALRLLNRAIKNAGN